MMSCNRVRSILKISPTHLNCCNELLRRFLLRKLALLAPVFAFLFFAQFASAQQGDAMFGGNALLSSVSCDATPGLLPKKGALYPASSADVLFNRCVGSNFATAWSGSGGS